MHTRSVLALLTLGLLAGCAPATRMTRPGHVPESVWVPCEADATRRMAPEATTTDVMVLPGGMAGAAALGLATAALSKAIAPDAATADAWGWNHVIWVCLRERGIPLP